MPVDGGSRYPGARPFRDDEVDAVVFRGRSLEIETLLHTVLSERLVLVHAKSGVGKTSLLNAGLATPLREAGHYPLFVRVNRPDLGLLDPIYDAIDRQAREGPVEYEPGDRASLWHFFKTAEFWREDRLLTPVLILDQFEELFTLHAPQQRKEFTRQLADLVRGRPPEDLDPEDGLTESPPVLRIVISMRDDFLGQMEELADRIPEILRVRFQLEPLNRAHASEAVLEPARIEHERIGGQAFGYSDEALQTILDLLCSQPHTGGEERAEPFQLQIICSRVEAIVGKEREQSPDYSEVTLEDLGGEKGIRKTIADFYRDQLSKLGRRRKLERMCEDGLINDDGRRLSADGDELTHRFKVPKKSLEALVECKVLRRDPRLGGVYYELSHDTLVEPVLKARRRRRRRNLTIKSALAAIFLVPIGGSLLATFLEDRAQVKEAEAAVKQAKQSVKTARSAQGAVGQLQPPPPDSLMVRVEETVRDAEARRAVAKEHLESESYRDAARAGLDAVDAATSACALMLERIVYPRVDAFLADAQGRIDDLEEVGAGQRFPERWSEILATFGVIALRAGDGCPEARHQLGLDELSEEKEREAIPTRASRLVTELSALEQELEDQWPRLAEIARGRAEEAIAEMERLGRPTAERLEADAREAAIRALEDGDRLSTRRSYLQARSAFREAAFSSNEAGEIRSAFQAREGWRGLVRAAAELGIADLGAIGEAGVRADSGRRAYERRIWALALSDFAAATTIGSGELAALTKTRDEALAARSAATAARELANLLATPEPEDQRNLNEGEMLYQAATLTFAANLFDDASGQFGRAAEEFSQVAPQPTQQALDEALASLEDERSKLSDTCDADDPEIQELCGFVEETLAQIAGAPKISRESLLTLAIMIEFQRRAAAKLSAAAQPPRIVARSPEDETLQVFRRQLVTLAVESVGSRGETLAYRWSTSSGPLGDTGPAIRYVPSASTRITVKVSGRGGEASESWDIEIANRRPKLSILPRERELSVAVGETISFEARPSDPDDDSVEVTFLIDGETVEKGLTFAFTAQRRGTRKLTIRAEDEGGATTFVDRTIRVRSPVIPTSGSGTEPTPDVELRPADHAQRILDEYRIAYEARDLDALLQIWDMNSVQRRSFQGLFASSRSIDLSIIVEDIRTMKGNAVEIDFEQQVRRVRYDTRKKTRAPEPPTTKSFVRSYLTATIVQRGKEGWIMTTLLPRRDEQSSMQQSVPMPPRDLKMDY